MVGLSGGHWKARLDALLAEELTARGLIREDIVGIADAWRMSGYGRKPDRRAGITELARRVGSTAPPPLFVIVRVHYWLYDDILAWLAPVFARRWDRAYGLRRDEIRRRWARAHSVRRPPPGVSNRYGYQGVLRLHDSIKTRRRWGAALGFRGTTYLLGYCATPAEAGRLYDRGLIALGERPVNFPDDVATTMLLPEPHIGPTTSVTKVLLQIVEKHGPIETDAMLDLLPSWPVQPTRPTDREKARATFFANLTGRERVVRVEGGWVLADRAGLYAPDGGRASYRHRHDEATKEQMLQLIGDGQSVRSVALAAGLSVDTVGAWARKAGVGRRQAQQRFSPEVHCAAVAAYAAGESSNSIAKRIPTSPSIVLGWVRAAGVEVRPKGSGGRKPGRVVAPGAVKADAVAAYLDGESSVAIAKRFGVSHASVRAWVIAAGHATRGRDANRLPDEQRAAALALYRQGVGSKAIARALGIASHTSVIQWAHDAGIQVRPKGRPATVRRSDPTSPSSLTSS